MKLKKLSVTIGVGALALVGCGPKGTEQNETLYALPNYDVETFNYLMSSSGNDADYYADSLDALIEGDRYGKWKGLIAESVVIGSDNGDPTLTFKIRDGYKWFTDKGEVYANITADDFVAAGNIVMDPYAYKGTGPSDNYWLYGDFIKGAYDYYYAKKLIYLEPKKDDTTANKKEWDDTLEEAGITTYSHDESAAVAAAGVSGVEKVDASHVKYTFAQKMPMDAILSVFAYSPFFPINKAFYEEKGSTGFGVASKTDSILYSGAYILKTIEKGKSYTYVKNDNYWNAANVQIKNVVKRLLPKTTGVVSTYQRKEFEIGKLSQFDPGLDDKSGWSKYVSGKENKKDGKYVDPSTGKKYDHWVSDPAKDTALTIELPHTTYSGVLMPNLARLTSDGTTWDEAQFSAYLAHWENKAVDGARDKTHVTADATDEAVKARIANTNKALQNVNYRKGLLFSFPRQLLTYDAAKYTRQMRNTYVHRDLTLDSDGKDYFEYTAAEIVKSWNTMAPANASAALTTAIAAAKPTSIADLEDGKDAYWNPQLGKLFFEAAKAELGSSVTWPVYIDFGYRHDSDTVQSYHEEIERVYNGIEAGGQKTAISPYKAEEYGINKDYVDMHSVGYKDNDYQDARRAGFWSLYIMSWGPDYADPKTYLDTWSTQGAWVPYLDLEEPGKSDLKKSILGPIDDDIKPSTDLLTDYYAATTDAARDAIAKARFQKMAEAEFNQIFKYGISLPAGCFRGNIGEVSRVTRIEPYTDGRSNIGLGNLRIKDRRLSKTPYTREQFKTIEDAWKVAKANAQGIV